MVDENDVLPEGSDQLGLPLPKGRGRPPKKRRRADKADIIRQEMSRQVAELIVLKQRVEAIELYLRDQTGKAGAHRPPRVRKFVGAR